MAARKQKSRWGGASGTTIENLNSGLGGKTSIADIKAIASNASDSSATPEQQAAAKKAVNAGDLATAVTAVDGKISTALDNGFKVKGQESTAAKTQALGDKTLSFAGANGLKATVSQTGNTAGANTVSIGLDPTIALQTNEIQLGSAGENSNKKDGKLSVKAKNGNDGVVIASTTDAGTQHTKGTITLKGGEKEYTQTTQGKKTVTTEQAKANGSASTTNIGVSKNAGDKTLHVSNISGKISGDGTRLTYTDGGETRKVASLDDGLIFTGDNNKKGTNEKDKLTRRLASTGVNSNTLNIRGGAAGDATATDNIKVIADSQGLHVRLAKDIDLGGGTITGLTDNFQQPSTGAGGTAPTLDSIAGSAAGTPSIGSSGTPTPTTSKAATVGDLGTLAKLAKDGLDGLDGKLQNAKQGSPLKYFANVGGQDTQIVKVGDKWYPADKVDDKGNLKAGASTSDAIDPAAAPISTKLVGVDGMSNTPLALGNVGSGLSASGIDGTKGTNGQANGATAQTATPANKLDHLLGKADNLNHAVNVGDLKTISQGLVDKGTVYQGDDGQLVNRKLGETLKLSGGETENAKLTATTAKNIGVVRNNSSDGLDIRLAKDLTGLTSVTTTNTSGGTSVLNAGGLTVTQKDSSVDRQAQYGADGIKFANSQGTLQADTPILNQQGLSFSDGSGNAKAGAPLITKDGFGFAKPSTQTGNNTAFDNTKPSFDANGINAGGQTVSNVGSAFDKPQSSGSGTTNAISTNKADLLGSDASKKQGAQNQIIDAAKEAIRNDSKNAVNASDLGAVTTAIDDKFETKLQQLSDGGFSVSDGTTNKTQKLGQTLTFSGANGLKATVTGNTAGANTVTLSLDPNAPLKTNTAEIGGLEDKNGDKKDGSLSVKDKKGVDNVTAQATDTGGKVAVKHPSGTGTNSTDGVVLQSDNTNGGSVAVNDKDGNTKVKLSNDPAAGGVISLTGATPQNGSAPTTNIQVVQDANNKPLDNAGNGTRLTYSDGNQTRQIASLDDGLKFTGNNGTVTVSRKLNQTLAITGGQSKASKLVDNDQNIGVIATADSNGQTNGGLSIKLAKDITGLDSLTAGTGDKQVKLDGSAGNLTVGNPNSNPTTIGKDNIKVGGKASNPLTLNGKDGTITGLTDNFQQPVAGSASGTAPTLDSIAGSAAGTPSIGSSGTPTPTTSKAATVGDLGTLAKLAKDGLDGLDGKLQNAKQGSPLKYFANVGGQDTQIVKVGDKWYPADKVDDKGNLKAGASTSDAIDPAAAPISTKLVGVDGMSNTPLALGNVGSGLSASGIDGKTGINGNLLQPAPQAPTNAQKLDHLLGKADNLNHAVNVGDLKTISQGIVDKGTVYQGDDGQLVNRKLGETLKLSGGITGKDAAEVKAKLATTANIGIYQNDKKDGLVLNLAKDLTGLTSVTTTNTSGGTSVLNAGGLTVTQKDSSVDRQAQYGADGIKFANSQGTLQADTPILNQQGLSFSDGSGNAKAGAPLITKDGFGFAKPSTQAGNNTAFDNTKPSFDANGINAGGHIITGVASGLAPNTQNAGLPNSLEEIAKNENNLNTATNAVNAGDVGRLAKLTKEGLDDLQSSLKQTGNIIGSNDPQAPVKDGNGNVIKQGLTAKEALTTYNVEGKAEYENNSVISAIYHMNEEGIKFFHTNDETRGSQIPAQGKNTIDASAGGARSTAVGYKAKVANTADDSIAMGSGSSVAEGATSAVAIGHGVAVNGADSVAIGKNSTVGGVSSIAIGTGAVVNGISSIAVGTGHRVNGNHSGAFGDPNVVTANQSYAFGNDNTIEANNVMVVGNRNTVQAANTMVLGNDVKVGAGNEGAVVLGDGSSVEGAHSGAYTLYGVNDAHVAGSKGAEAQVASVGAKGRERQIQNVAPGVVSRQSTDAINGSQLYRVADDLHRNISEVDARARAGIASSMATAGLPQAYLPGKSMVGAAVSHYRGNNALAIGVSTISDNGKWIVKGTANFNSEDAGATLGVGYQW